jgi:hypothetical protein
MPIVQQILPSVNMSGTFSVNAPFNKIIDRETIYTVEAIESLSAIIAQGRDPIAEVYTPVGLPTSSMTSDLNNDIVIVSLKDATGTITKVPGSYFITLPSTSGVLYTNLMIGIPLSALPDTMNISSLTTQIADLVSGTIGITVEPKVMKYGQGVYLTEDEHLAAEAARARAIVIGNSLTAQLNVSAGIIVDLQTKINQLQKYILSLQASGTIAVPVTQVTPAQTQAAQAAAQAIIDAATAAANAAAQAAANAVVRLQNTLATSGFAIQFTNTAGNNVMLCTANGLYMDDTYAATTSAISTSVVSTASPQGAYFVFDTNLQAQTAWAAIQQAVATTSPEVTISGTINNIAFTVVLPISTSLTADIVANANNETIIPFTIIPSGNMFALEINNQSLNGQESYLAITADGASIDSGNLVSSYQGKLTKVGITNGISPVGQTILFDTKAQAQAAIGLIASAYSNNQNNVILSGTVLGAKFTGTYNLTPELIIDLGNTNTPKNQNALYGNSFNAVPVVLN